MEIIAPEIVQRVSPHEVSRLDTAISVVAGRDRELAEKLEGERDELQSHRSHIDALGHRMKFGSAVPWHPEGVMDWLIAQGWTPPSGVLLVAPVQSDGSES